MGDDIIGGRRLLEDENLRANDARANASLDVVSRQSIGRTNQPVAEVRVRLDAVAELLKLRDLGGNSGKRRIEQFGQVSRAHELSRRLVEGLQNRRARGHREVTVAARPAKIKQIRHVTGSVSR